MIILIFLISLSLIISSELYVNTQDYVHVHNLIHNKKSCIFLILTPINFTPWDFRLRHSLRNPYSRYRPYAIAGGCRQVRFCSTDSRPK